MGGFILCVPANILTLDIIYHTLRTKKAQQLVDKTTSNLIMFKENVQCKRKKETNKQSTKCSTNTAHKLLIFDSTQIHLIYVRLFESTRCTTFWKCSHFGLFPSNGRVLTAMKKKTKQTKWKFIRSSKIKMKKKRKISRCFELDELDT